MSILERMKAMIVQKAQTSVEKWQRSTMFVVSGAGKKDAKRQDFSPYAAAMSYRSWIYAAANLNAVAVASVPLRLYVRNRSTGTKLWKTKSPSRRTKAFIAGDLASRPSNYVVRKAAEYGTDFEVVTDTHPILELLAKVNPYQNGYDATVLRVLYTELTGNAYIHPVLDPTTKRPVQLWTMPSQFVEIVPGKEKFIEAYLYGSSREQRKIFEPDEVIHFKRPNPNDLYYGIGKVEAAWSAVQMNAAVHEMDLSFFENKARPDYLMTIRGDASADEIERLETQIDEKLRGSRRTGRFLTATSDIDIKPLSFPPKDLAGRESIVEEIAAIFGVPVSMLKANDPNLASAQTGYAMWRESTILPMLRMDEEVLNQNLLPLFGIEDDAFLAYDNPVVDDRRLELEEIRTAVSGGWMTVNEARAAEGMEPLDDEFADRALVNGQPLGGMAAAAPPPALPEASADPESVPVAEASAQDAEKGIPAIWGIDIDAKADLDDCVSSKIPKLIEEGYPQDQAVAIAYSMCREGKSFEEVCAGLDIPTKAFDLDDVETKALGDIDTTPPKTVAENARRALEVRASKPESQRGMTAVGIARARDLANRKPLSEDTIRRMLSYFERHEVDKQGSTWDEQGKGWQAWYGWGGDDGFAWSRRKVDEFDRERGRSESKSSGCSCGCKSRSVPIFPAGMGSKDCGTGAGGFQPGNTCGEGDGSGGDDAESKPLRVVETDAGHKVEEFKADAESPLDVLNDETDKESDVVVDWDAAKDRVEKDALDGTSARESMKKYEANLYRVFTDMSPDAPEVNEAMMFASNHEPERHGGMSNTEYNQRSLSTPKQAEQEIRRMVDEGTFFSQDEEDNLKPSEKEDKIQIAEANRRIELMSALDGERAERAESALKSIRNELETKVAESRLKCCVRLLRGIRNLAPSQLEEMIQSGFVSHEGLNSWTTDRKVADLFLGGDREGGVLLVTKSPKVGWVNMMDSRQEKEVVRPPSSMRISKVTRTKSGTIIEVEEDEDYDGTR